MFITTVCVYFLSDRLRVYLWTMMNWLYSVQIMELTQNLPQINKELIVLNILRCKYCVNKSRDMSRDHFSKNLK